MRITKMGGCPKSPATKNLRRRKLGAHFRLSSDDHTKYGLNNSINPSCNGANSSVSSSSSYCSPNLLSPRSQSSPYMKSPWTHGSSSSLSSSEYEENDEEKDRCSNPTTFAKHGMIGSISRVEGHIYSLAAAGDLLYTGSQSKNVRVWKNLEDFSGFKSGSGLVKAIVVLGDRVFTGHQDGKIRVWGVSGHDKGNVYARVGSLPTTRDLLKKSMNPKSYVQVRRKRSVPWIKHYDAVSCMSIDVDQGLLYSGSWDKTLKVWRISDYKCVESIHAHDDAVNAVAAAFSGIVFTGSADGTVKAWRLEVAGPKRTKHVLMETLLTQEHAMTSLAVSHASGTVYAGSSNGLVSFWERGRLKPQNVSVLRGHKLAVLCLAVGGNLVMSGSADKSICVWRRDHGGVHACVAVLTGHTGPVKCLTVEKDTTGVAEEKESFPTSLNGSNTIKANLTDSDNERWIVYSGSLDKSVKVWRVSAHAPSLEELQDDME